MAITPYRSRQSPLRGTLFDEWFPNTNLPFARGPQTDVVENEDEIQVMVELPGMSAEDIQVDLENNVLSVSGEKREETSQNTNNGTWHLTERSYGRFTRSFRLPRDVESDKVEADFQNGLLTITVPKSERAKPRHIPIGERPSERRRIETRGSGEGSNQQSSPNKNAGSGEGV